MIEKKYTGFRHHGRTTIVYLSGPEIVDLGNLAEAENVLLLAMPGWANDYAGSLHTATCLLWHCTRDRALTEDLHQLLAHEMVRFWADDWELPQHRLERWILEHQPYRRMLHGSINGKCAGCGE